MFIDLVIFRSGFTCTLHSWEKMVRGQGQFQKFGRQIQIAECRRYRRNVRSLYRRCITDILGLVHNSAVGSKAAFPKAFFSYNRETTVTCRHIDRKSPHRYGPERVFLRHGYLLSRWRPKDPSSYRRTQHVAPHQYWYSKAWPKVDDHQR